MCPANRNLSRKSRILLALGNLCMFSGLAMSHLNRSLQHTNVTHFLAGFLLGLAITLLLAVAFRARRTNQAMR